MEQRESDLRQRWVALPSFNLRQSLISAGGNSPFGLTGAGLLDFRGVNIAESLHKLTFKECDFSFCRMTTGQIASRVANCLFRASTLDGNIGNDFSDCDFSKSRLDGAVIRGAFCRCAFSSASFVLARASKARFIDCSFTSAKMRKASFFECSFQRCSFDGAVFRSGSLADSQFIDCTFSDASLSEMVLTGTSGLPESLFR